MKMRATRPPAAARRAAGGMVSTRGGAPGWPRPGPAPGPCPGRAGPPWAGASAASRTRGAGRSCRGPSDRGAARGTRAASPPDERARASSRRRQRVGDLARHVVAHRLGGHLDRVADGARARAPVALDEELLEAQDRRAAVLRVVGERPQPLDAAREEAEPERP